MDFVQQMEYLRTKFEEYGSKGFTVAEAQAAAINIGKNSKNDFHNGFKLAEISAEVWPDLLAFIKGKLTLASNAKVKLQGPTNNLAYKDFVRKFFLL